VREEEGVVKVLLNYALLTGARKSPQYHFIHTRPSTMASAIPGARCPRFVISCIVPDGPEVVVGQLVKMEYNILLECGEEEETLRLRCSYEVKVAPRSWVACSKIKGRLDFEPSEPQKSVVIEAFPMYCGRLPVPRLTLQLRQDEPDDKNRTKIKEEPDLHFAGIKEVSVLPALGMQTTVLLPNQSDVENRSGEDFDF